MANVDNPRGFRPATPIARAHVYVKGTAAAIYPGDAVIMNSAGAAVVATAGSAELLGVALNYRAATDTSVLVCDDPDQMYYVQDDGVGGTLAATSVGNNLDIVVTAGNATFLKSQHEADTSTIQTTSAQLRVLGKHPDSEWLDNVELLVVINEGHFDRKLAGI